MCFFKKLHNFNDNIKKRPTTGETDIYYDSFSITSSVDVQPNFNVQSNTINQNEHVILRGNPPRSCGPPDRIFMLILLKEQCFDRMGLLDSVQPWTINFCFARLVTNICNNLRAYIY